MLAIEEQTEGSICFRFIYTRSRGFAISIQTFVGVNIWICVLDYLNKTQDSRSFGAAPPCQDLMKNACKHNIKILEK